MITKLKRVKTLGIFSDFTWGEELPDFGRYNLFYGWNGSGKTTLSNLFAALATGSTPAYPGLEYEAETNTGTVRHGEALSTKLRVFNPDYVAKNVYTVSGKARPILILGEENKKAAADIAADEATLAAKNERLQKLKAELEAASKRKDRVFSDIAKTIGLNTSGLAARTYRKPDAEENFAALSSKALLDDAEVTASALELKQQEKADVREITTPRLSFDGKEVSFPVFLSSVGTTAAHLCAQTVESRVIERLRQRADLAEWVERGIALHKAHESKACEFCAQALPTERMGALVAHFNEADKQLKGEIDRLLEHVDRAEQALRTCQPPDKANLYDELQVPYQLAVERITAARAALVSDLGDFRTRVAAKKAKTTESVALTVTLDGAGLVEGIEAANGEIGKHKSKTANFKAAKDAARKKLETHYLSAVYDDVKALEKTIGDLKVEVANVTDGDASVHGDLGLAALTERIKSNRATISSSHKGCKEINDSLRTFLGRDELQFDVDSEGYVLRRGGKPAQHLSEGEKAAIGFVHFIITLKEQDFDPANGIIVVDDPVSSLDSNSIFQAFAFLKNAVKDAKQVFLLTHDFDFLRLLINWMSHSKQRVGYYMIKDVYDGNGARVASIHELDKLLREHESEYHYLFKLLHTFQTDGTIESVYNVPNIARKVLEFFLMFRVPSNASPFNKMEALKPYFDENKLTAIYKFTNDQSHMTGKGFDPSLVGETQKNVKYLLEMIEAVFPEHYKILVASLAS